MYHAALECSTEIAKERYHKLVPLILNDNFKPNIDIEEEFKLLRMVNEYEKPILRSKYRGAFSTGNNSPVRRKVFYNLICGMLHLVVVMTGMSLKLHIQDTWAIRNSLLVAPMPTASYKSQISGL